MQEQAHSPCADDPCRPEVAGATEGPNSDQKGIDEHIGDEVRPEVTPGSYPPPCHLALISELTSFFSMVSEIDGHHYSFHVSILCLRAGGHQGRMTLLAASVADPPWSRPNRGSAWEPDPLILDDQALIIEVAGKGLAILTGCGHAGVVNICRYARRLTGVDRTFALIGGFHLNGQLFEPFIETTREPPAELAPEVIVPSHWTGWKATHALGARVPDAFIQNSVGTTFELTAA